MATINSGQSASFTLDAFGYISVQQADDGTLVGISQAANLKSNVSYSKVAAVRYGPFGVPMDFILTCENGSITYTTTNGYSAIVDGGFVVATQGEAEAGADNERGMTPLRTKQAIEYQRQFATEGEAQTAADAAKVASVLNVKQYVDYVSGVALGLAELGADGKVPSTQLPESLGGGLSYQGVWNASTNTPTIPTAVGNNGEYYKVSVSGTTSIDGIATWAVGDWIISNGTTWDKIANSETVSSVASRTGAVVLTKADVGLSNVDNTSDANKPVSTATQDALNLKADLSSLGGLAVQTFYFNGAGSYLVSNGPSTAYSIFLTTSAVSGSVRIYDNTEASGPDVLGSTATVAASNVQIPIGTPPTYGAANTGLYLVVVAANVGYVTWGE